MELKSWDWARGPLEVGGLGAQVFRPGCCPQREMARLDFRADISPTNSPGRQPAIRRAEVALRRAWGKEDQERRDTG